MPAILANILKKLPHRNSFVRSVSVLAGGTAFSQALMVLALPVLTRLYSPESYGVLAVYVAILGILGSIACLRFEIAIPLPDSDEEAINLFVLAFLFPTVIALIVTLLIFFSGDSLVSVVAQKSIKPYLWLVPLGIWLLGVYNAFQYWTTRKKNFPLVAKTKLFQAIIGTGVQVGLGWFGVAPLGLLLGQIVKNSAGIVGLSKSMLKNSRTAIMSITYAGMVKTFHKFDRFPKYSTFETLTNNAGVQLPVLVIASVVAGAEVGNLMLATQILSSPMGLIGASVAQVYLSTAAEAYRDNSLGKHTADVIAGLSKIGVGPLIFAGVVAPVAFPIVFGPEWARAGQIVAWMTPWFVVQFLVSPVSMTLHVTGQQATALALQIVGLVLRLGAVIGAGVFFKVYVVEVYAVSGFVFYALYLFVVTRIAGIKFRDLLAVVPGKILIAWTVLSFVFLWAIPYVVDYMVYFSRQD